MTESSLPETMPSQIGSFQIVGLLEQGGMSLLYAARHETTGSPAIIKVLLPQYMQHPEAVMRFMNEINIIELTDHPHIVKLYEHGVYHDGLYIAMEFVPGMSLRKHLAKRPFPLKKALTIILQIADAVQHLHNHHVIHGDLKPENILLDDTNVKLIDFGVAKSAGLPQASTHFIGTPIYMSPEVISNPDSFSFQSDIYALGIIAYELLLGKITHGKVILSLAPQGVQSILRKALEPDLTNRYKTTSQFIDDLTAYQNSALLEKDREGIDYLYELYDELSSLQKQEFAASPFTFQYRLFFGLELQGIYVDMFSLGNETLLFIARAKESGLQGLIEAKVLKSIVRSRKDNYKTAQELFDALSKEITQTLQTPFEIQIIAVTPGTDVKYYSTYDGGAIFVHHASKKNTLLSTTHSKESFTKGDRLFVISCDNQAPIIAKALSLSLTESFDTIQRSLQLSCKKLLPSTVSFLGLLELV